MVFGFSFVEPESVWVPVTYYDHLTYPLEKTCNLDPEQDGDPTSPDKNGVFTPYTYSKNSIYREFNMCDPSYSMKPTLPIHCVKKKLNQKGKPQFDSTTQSKGCPGCCWYNFYMDEWFVSNDSSTYKNPKLATNRVLTDSLLLKKKANGIYWYENSNFFPLNNKGLVKEGLEAAISKKNFGFTMHMQKKIPLPPDSILSKKIIIEGDDDIWLYINGHLIVDLGGVHPTLGRMYSLNDVLDTLNLYTPTYTKPDTLTYDIFFAERLTSGSSLKFELPLYFSAPLVKSLNLLNTGTAKPIFPDNLLSTDTSFDIKLVLSDSTITKPVILIHARSGDSVKIELTKYSQEKEFGIFTATLGVNFSTNKTDKLDLALRDTITALYIKESDTLKQTIYTRPGNIPCSAFFSIPGEPSQAQIGPQPATTSSISLSVRDNGYRTSDLGIINLLTRPKIKTESPSERETVFIEVNSTKFTQVNYPITISTQPPKPSNSILEAAPGDSVIMVFIDREKPTDRCSDTLLIDDEVVNSFTKIHKLESTCITQFSLYNYQGALEYTRKSAPGVCLQREIISAASINKQNSVYKQLSPGVYFWKATLFDNGTTKNIPQLNGKVFLNSN